MNEKTLGFLISEGQRWNQKNLMWVTKPKLNINRRKLRREANGQKAHVHQSLRTTWKDFLTVPVQLSWSGCGQEPNVIQYQVSLLPGAGERDSVPSVKRGCSFSCQRKAWWAKDLCTIVFRCPGIVEHFACKSHSLCTILLLILVLLLFALSSYFCVQQIFLISAHDLSLFCSPPEGGKGSVLWFSF